MTAKIKLNAASGGGSISIQAPSSSSNNRVIALPDIADGTLVTSQSTLDATKLSGNLPALNGSALTNIDGGKILKVYSVQTTSGQDITSSSYVDITGLTITLTPAATSKCLVHAVASGYGEWTSTYFGFNKMQVLRGSTTIGVDSRNIRLQTHSSTDYLQNGCPLTQTVFDTHGANGSTAVTYKCQGLTNAGHMYVNSSYGTYSSLTVYEVAPN